MIDYGNVVMVCGSGRHVGKTTLSELIVKYYTQKGKEVYAIKTSSHLHDLDKEELVIDRGLDYAVVKELRNTTKDSALLLKAGTKESYYMQSTSQERLFEKFKALYGQIPSDAIVICESGGLREFFKPALFLFVSGNAVTKNLRYKPYADFDLQLDVDFNQTAILNMDLPLESLL
ncbi:P-loop NTPase family protein [Labilibacter marinus]|uniref:hypothetical protein n=1 Tax=Labilibacter marinus TaxID=1477105 RepID=UPI00095026FB|nr:hypothetical protein [Labilibacter marinus]